jgi:hypothetical protein
MKATALKLQHWLVLLGSAFAFAVCPTIHGQDTHVDTNQSPAELSPRPLMSDQEAETYSAHFRLGMTFREVRRWISFDTNNIVMAKEAGGHWLGLQISSNRYMQFRFEHPSHGRGMDDCRVNYEPVLRPGQVHLRGVSTFVRGDITNLTFFAQQLQRRSDPVSVYLMAQFSPSARAAVSRFAAASLPSVEFEDIIVQQLNKAVLGDSIYEEHRFSGVTLSQETKNLLGLKLERGGLTRLNRLLLEDAFPTAICRTPRRYVVAPN